MNNKIKSYCRYYDLITNCEFLDSDLFSKKLVEYYKLIVSKVDVSNEDNIKKIVKYDRIMKKYIEDYDFSRKLRNSIDVSSILYSELDLSTAVLDYACDFEDKYDCEVEPTVINTRWI